MKSKVIIIGAGVSGLSAGIFAQTYGFDSVIIEKNHFAGGNLTGWKRKDCYIDNCIHWLNGSKNTTGLNALWKEVGAFKDIEFHQSDAFLVSEFNGQTVALHKDLNKTHKQMLEISPADKKQIEKFIKAVEIIKNFYASNNFINYIKLFFLYKNKTIGEVANCFKHELLKKFISDYILPEYSIYTLLAAYASFCAGDGKVLKNGSAKMADNIKEKYLSLGGEIKFNSEVEEILIQSNQAVGVRLKNSEEIFAHYIICCCDPKIVFDKMLPNTKMPKKLQLMYENKKSYPVISSFHIAYKVTSDIKIPETFVFEMQKTIKIGATVYNRLMIRSYDYGSNFTTENNSYVLQVFLLQREIDYDYWAKLSKEEYAQNKKQICNHITNEIVLRYKELQNNIEYLDCWTPLTYTKYFDAYKGSYMSFGITKRFVFKTFKNKIKGINNLYFASQWQKLFGGLPNALKNGKSCIEYITKNRKN